MRRLLFIVVDALSSRHVEQALRDNRLPNLRRLVEAGEMHPESISIFPSITPAATASLVTGAYPSEHGIAGAFFYDTETDRVNFFGDDIWAIIGEGIGKFFNDFLIRLNEEILSAETLFRRVENAGGTAASLNYLVFQGNKKHPVNVPWLLRMFPGVPWKEEVHGPDLLCLGDLVSGDAAEKREPLTAPGGVFKRFGFQDDTTAALLIEMAKKNEWRDFNLAYFPDNDFDSHSDGPTSAITTVEKFDTHLGNLFEVCGGLEKFLAETTILITGDHSQSDVVADEQARGIQLEELLEDFSLVPAGSEWTNDKELMVCPNMRACRIYVRRGNWSNLDTIVERLLSDPRVDQAIWRMDVEEGGHRFHVATKERGELGFWKNESDTAMGRDVFGNRWSWEGSLETVDGSVSEDGELVFDEYPNAFERVATSFVGPLGGDLWLTAKVGYEFKIPDVKIHDAGSHGSLHKFDSTSPMIVAGAPEGFRLPRHLRGVDAAGLCSTLMGLAKQGPTDR